MPGDALGRWLFGKMPSHGDFISRGIDHKTRDALDAWLSGEMVGAREDFADDSAFDAAWRAAPAWLFVEAAGERWQGGALAASLDAVGRRYPLVMAAPAETIADASGVATGCLAAISLAFEQGHDADWLHEAPLETVDFEWQPEAPEWVLAAEAGPGLRLTGQRPEGLVATMMSEER